MHNLLFDAENSQAKTPLIAQVPPFIPILYFGNLNEYERSDKRIVTVALNPSGAEFPVAAPFLRFPALQSYSPTQQQAERFATLRSGYDAYFDNAPYMQWFGHFEHVLSGFGASFLEGPTRRALHTDLMSPVATQPTWSKLAPATQMALSGLGVQLWHGLIEFLSPDLLLVSVARANFRRIVFPLQGTASKSIVVGGKSRYPVTGHTVLLKSGKFTDVVYTTPAQVPFGFLSHSEKGQVGKLFSGKLANW